jgi:hypothetical protein
MIDSRKKEVYTLRNKFIKDPIIQQKGSKDPVYLKVPNITISQNKK